MNSADHFQWLIQNMEVKKVVLGTRNGAGHWMKERGQLVARGQGSRGVIICGCDEKQSTLTCVKNQSFFGTTARLHNRKNTENSANWLFKGRLPWVNHFIGQFCDCSKRGKFREKGHNSVIVVSARPCGHVLCIQKCRHPDFYITSWPGQFRSASRISESGANYPHCLTILGQCHSKKCQFISY